MSRRWAAFWLYWVIDGLLAWFEHIIGLRQSPTLPPQALPVGAPTSVSLTDPNLGSWVIGDALLAAVALTIIGLVLVTPLHLARLLGSRRSRCSVDLGRRPLHRHDRRHVRLGGGCRYLSRLVADRGLLRTACGVTPPALRVSQAAPHLDQICIRCREQLTTPADRRRRERAIRAKQQQLDS